jgi:aspartate carbamoyltransferase catalytic subunit
MMLRIQTEREHHNIFPSLREYAKYFGLNRKNIRLAKDDVLVMHPGPVNRGIEIAPDIADGPASVILEQVTNGVAVRMALLYLLSGGKS